VLEAIGLGGEENAGRRLTVLRAIDKLDKFGPEGVRLLLGKGRWDGGKEGEGDFTKGAGLDDEQANKLLNVIGEDRVHSMQVVHLASEPLADDLDSPNLGSTAKVLNTLVLDEWEEVLSQSEVGSQGLSELREIAALLTASGYGTPRVRISPSVVRGLEYYTGPVFEAELLAEIPNEDGQIVRFGSVGGGGRYDGLVSRFRGEPVPATGFSIGVSRLLTALKNLGKLADSDSGGPVVVLVMDRDTESLGRYQKMVAELRRAGIRAEMYLGGSGMKPQMKYADRRKAPCVVIQGGDERAKGEVQVKDMVVGAALAADISGHEAYKEARPGQVTVPESELVATVQGMLAAQKAERG
jgi:histidyl-tRNA synthetase